MTKVSEGQVFESSDLFKTCVGFFVRCRVESVEGGTQPLAVAHAWEEDGYEVVFTGTRSHLVALIGAQIDVPGHAILGYSGAVGGWAKARVRTP